MKINNTVEVFRAVGFAEFSNIMETGKFNLRPNGLESKHFGMKFEETLDFANKVFNVHVAAIIEITVNEIVLKRTGDFTSVDSSVFKSGTVAVYKEYLEKFNTAVLEIKHVF